MNEKMRNSLASAELEGFEFTAEQVAFLTDLAGRMDRGEITWDEAVKLVKARHNSEGN